MNISMSETECLMVAKTCRCTSSNNDKGRKIAYSFIDMYHSLSLNRKEIILAELCACKKLLDNTENENDRNLIETEVSELRMMLDLMH